MEPEHMIQLLSPDLDIPHAAADPTGPAADDLLRRITSAPPPAARRRWGPRLAVGGALVTGVAAAVVAASVWLPDSTPGGPGPARATALRFTADAKYLDIRIVDPAADPQRYRAELAAHGLDIDLSLAAAEPGDVGRVIFQEESVPGIKLIEAPGDCTANGACGVGVQVPLDYRGHANIVFGRTPRPGETVEGDAPILAPAQKAQLHALIGQKVADARRQLAAHGQTPSYRVTVSHSAGHGVWIGKSLPVPAPAVLDTWIVYDVAPLPGNVVAMWVSKDGKPQHD
jgi:hypothetical protein